MTRRAPQSLIKRLGAQVMPEWTEHAACGELTPAQMRAFFPDLGDDVHAAAHTAKAICARCPVNSQVCADYGDRVSKSFGTFGGLTASERKRRRDALGRAA